MTFGQRFLLTLIIIIVILFALAVLGYFTGNWDEDESARPGYPAFTLASAESQPIELELCMDEQTREQIRNVMIEALDDALKDHIKHVFEIWLKDERGQPGRARTGVRQGIKAYLGARKGALEWMPPLCAN
jgi:hypothetical protein